MGLTQIGRRHLLRALRPAYSFVGFSESPHYTPSRDQANRKLGTPRSGSYPPPRAKRQCWLAIPDSNLALLHRLLL